MKMNKLAAIIPALNESLTIGEVVDHVSKFAVPIVIDDGSVDGTAEIAKDKGAIVISHEYNKGYDRALESGLQKAASLDFEYAITIDADGQHDPGLIAQFHSYLQLGYDVVVGSRNRHQRIAEKIFSYFGRAFWGIQDPLCGMKAYRLDSLVGIIGRNPKYDSIGTSYAILAAKSRNKIVNIPIVVRNRADSPRFGSGLKANLKIIKALVHAL